MGNPEHQGLDGDRLRHLNAVMEADIARGRYFGGVLIVARRGERKLSDVAVSAAR